MNEPLHNEFTTQAKIIELKDLTPTVREFTLELPRALPWSPGSHLPISLEVKGFKTWRHYSLTGATHPQRYQFAVKKLDQGRGGSMALWSLKLGELVHVGTPKNHFSLDTSAPSYLLVAGGIGVTPFVSMVQAIKAQSQRQKSPAPSIKMLYGARDEQELAYIDFFRQNLQATQLHVCVDDKGERFDFRAQIAQLASKTQAYVCGPQAMLSAFRLAWSDSERALEDLHFETFGTSGAQVNEAFSLKVPRHGVDLVVGQDETLLEVLERNGVQTLYDCQRGECGLCAMDVLALDGVIDHRDVFLSPHEKSSNQKICVCVSRVCGTIILDSAYREDEIFVN